MIFKDDAHREFFETNARGLDHDPYRRALIYTLGINEDCRKHFKKLYIDGGPNWKELNAHWQTSGSLRITRLAFNLFNGCCLDGEETSSNEYSPYYLFCDSQAPWMVEAIKVRYPNMFK